MATIIDDQSLTVSVTSDAVTVTEGDGATFTVAVTGDMSTAHVHVALHGAPDGDVRHGLHGAVGDAGRWVTNVGGDEHDDVGRGLSHSRGGTARARASGPARNTSRLATRAPAPITRARGPSDATNRNYIAGRANSGPAPEVPERAGRPGQHDQPPRGRRHAERQLGGNLRSSHSLRGSCGQPSGPRRSTTSPRLRSRLVRFRRKINPWPKAA